MEKLTKVLLWHYGYIEQIDRKDEHYYAGHNAESKRMRNQTFERELAQLVDYHLVRVTALLTDILMSREIPLNPFRELIFAKGIFRQYEQPSRDPVLGYMKYDFYTIFHLNNMRKALDDSVTYFTALGEARLLPRE